jgi:ribulose-5-phosphate 4-epimerase/fuculose-1-phosphate aldolase
MATQMKPRSVRDQVTAEEWQARVDLACAHRLIADFGILDLTYNHLSARVPGEPNRMIIKSQCEMFDEVTASSLETYDVATAEPIIGGPRPLSGGGLVIHAGILGARPDINAVFHTHSPANMAVSCHKCGLLPITQAATRFRGRLGYHAFGGYEFELSMRDRLLVDLGDNLAVILHNHGGLTVGRCVAEAFLLHHQFEMACRAQVGALAGGLDNVRIPPDAVIDYAVTQVTGGTGTGGGRMQRDWEACLRRAERLDPAFKD